MLGWIVIPCSIDIHVSYYLLYATRGIATQFTCMDTHTPIMVLIDLDLFIQ